MVPLTKLTSATTDGNFICNLLVLLSVDEKSASVFKYKLLKKKLKKQTNNNSNKI